MSTRYLLFKRSAHSAGPYFNAGPVHQGNLFLRKKRKRCSLLSTHGPPNWTQSGVEIVPKWKKNEAKTEKNTIGAAKWHQIEPGNGLSQSPPHILGKFWTQMAPQIDTKLVRRPKRRSRRRSRKRLWSISVAIVVRRRDFHQICINFG